jgi:DNA polymerase/3'-5' exonuclease PolX
MTNQQIACRLQKVARVLSQRGENLFRIRAYRRAAWAALENPEPITPTGVAISGMGESIADAVRQWLREEAECELLEGNAVTNSTETARMTACSPSFVHCSN